MNINEALKVITDYVNQQRRNDSYKPAKNHKKNAVSARKKAVKNIVKNKFYD